MTKISLIRHGETLWNVRMRFQGHSNVDLNAMGIRQAEGLAARFANTTLHAVYASDLNRALDTAKMIADKHGLEVIKMPEFRELNFGEWEGQGCGEMAEKSKAIDLFYNSPDKVVIPGGERFIDLQNRAMEAIMKLVEKHECETILVAAHAGTIRTILCAVLHLELKYLWNIKQDNTAVSVIEFHNGKAMVSLINDVHHLDGIE